MIRLKYFAFFFFFLCETEGMLEFLVCGEEEFRTGAQILKQNYSF